MTQPDEGPVDLDLDKVRGRIVRAGWVCIATLAIAGLAAAWETLAFLQRGAGDVRITTQREELFGTGFSQTKAADYSDHFLVRSEGPFLIAMALATVAFICWQLSVDRVARACGDPMDANRWQPVWGWFVPLANLIYPLRSVRELADVHGAERARRLVGPWWLLWAVALLVNAFVLNSSSASVSGEVGQLDTSPGATFRQLDHLDNYHVFAGSCFAVDALLAIAMVYFLTAQVRWRLTPDEE
jgi:hypothetical protein